MGIVLDLALGLLLLFSSVSTTAAEAASSKNLSQPKFQISWPNSVGEQLQTAGIRDQLIEKFYQMAQDDKIQGQERTFVYYMLADLLQERSPRSALQYLSMASSSYIGDGTGGAVRSMALTKAEVFRGMGLKKEAIASASKVIKDNKTDKAIALKALNLMIEMMVESKEFGQIRSLINHWPYEIVGISDLSESSLTALYRSLNLVSHEQALDLLHELASKFLHTKVGRSAFGRIIRLMCQSKTYHPTMAFLDGVRNYANLDIGLKQWAIQALTMPIKDGDRLITMSEYERFQKLVSWRLFDEANMLAPSIDLSRLSVHDQREFTILYYRSLLRQNRLDQALVQAHKLRAYRVDPRSRIAEVLKYKGLFNASAKIYQRLSYTRNQTYFTWRAFWDLISAERNQDGIAMFERCASRSQLRCFSDPGQAEFWYGQLLERVGRNDDASQVYKGILEREADSYYGALVLADPKTQRLVGVQPDVKTWTNHAVPGETADFDDVHSVNLFPKVRSYLREMVRTEQSPTELKRLSKLSDHFGYYLGSLRAQRQLSTKRIAYDGLGSYLKSFSVFKGLWKTNYPLPFPKIVAETASRYELDEILIYSIMRAESFYNPLAKSSVGAKGLLQVMPYTAMKIAREQGLKDFRYEQLESPAFNIPLAGSYLRKLLDYYDRNIVVTLAAYNAGPDNVAAWLERCNGCDALQFVESIPFRETASYVKKIIKYYNKYALLYGRNFPQVTMALPHASGKEVPIY